jgi:hypothetical protein
MDEVPRVDKSLDYLAKSKNYKEKTQGLNAFLQRINIKPTDKLSSKDCMVDFVGNKTNRNFTLVFDNNGKASIRK